MYLFIHQNLPPTADWDPRPAVLHWISKKERRNHSVPKKATRQSYYRNFFYSEATSVDDNCESHVESVATESTFRARTRVQHSSWPVAQN